MTSAEGGEDMPSILGQSADAVPWIMQPLRWERRPDGLRAPALVCAFKGWNDAGESATPP